MTIIELAFFSIHVIVGVLVGSALSEPFGAIGAIGGFALGSITSFGLLWSGSWLLDFAADKYPRRPQCRKKKCRWDCYRWIESRNGGIFVQCECGDYYFQKAREFFEVLPDGSTRPYMIKLRFRGWNPVEASCDSQGTKSEGLN